MEPSHDTSPEASRSGEWQELRGHFRHQTVEVLRLISILVQDAVILLAGFVAEFVYERWLHSSQPFFQLAISLSSALFLLLYCITVTVHLVNYVRGQFGAAPASLLRQYLPWGLAAGGLITAAVAVTVPSFWGSTRPVEQALRPLVRLDVDLGPGVSLGSFDGTDAILSPDGTRLVYVSQGRLFTRRLDQPNATELAGTQGANAPFFSPDGQWVAFFTSGKLQKISVEGGSAVTLCDAISGRGGSWGEDGSVIAALSLNGGLSRIPFAGGSPTPVTDLQNGEVTHRWPQILPGGKAVLFTASPSIAYDAANIEVMSLADRRRKTLVRGGTFGRYLPSGHLVYVNRGTLFAVPFDVDRLEVHGTPVPVLDHVGYTANTGSAQFDFSQTGTLIYSSDGAAGELLTIAWLDGEGKAQPLLAKPGAYGRLSLSPDGQRLALDVTEGSGTDIWVYDWQRNTMTRLTFTGNAEAPVWSPDGRYIAFQRPGEGMSVTRSDGSGMPQPLTQSKDNPAPYSFTPDGKRLAFQAQGSGTAYDLWTVPLESDNAGLRAGKPEVFLQTLADERARPFLRMADGWPTVPMSQGQIRFTCEPSRTRAASGKSRTAVACSRCGRATGTNYFSTLWIATSWWRHIR